MLKKAGGYTRQPQTRQDASLSLARPQG